MLVSILKAIAALPALIEVLKNLGEWAERVKLESYIKELNEASALLKSALTSEERMDAARKMQDLVRRL